MKQLSAIITIILLALAGCQQGSVDSPRLVELDSLIAVAPDSAAALLAAYPDDSLLTNDDRAYRAMLLTQAKYKAYIPAYRLDTINLAVAHYADGHDTGKRTRSLLYKGCVFEDLSRLDSAMYYYKAAEDHAARSGDTYHRGYALMRMAWLYQTQQSASTNRIAANKFRLALDLFKKLGDKGRQLDCMTELSSLLYPFDADSALYFVKQSEEYCLLLGNEARLYTIKRVKAQIMLDMQRYREAKNLALEVMNHCNSPIEYYNSAITLTYAYSKLGIVDSAEFFFNLAPQPFSHRDSVIYFRALAELRQAKHDINGYVNNSELAINTTDIIEDSVAKKGLSIYEAQVEKYLVIKKTQAQRNRLAKLLLCVIALMAVLGYLAWRMQFKRKQAEEQAKKMGKNLNLLDRQLSQALSEHEQAQNDSIELKKRLGQETALKSMLESKLQQESDSKKQLLQALENLKEHSRLLGEHPTLKLTENWVSMLVELVNKFNSKKQKDRTLRECVNKEIFTDELLQCLVQYIDAKYEGLATKVADQGDLNNRDINVMCMHFCGFSNAAIKAYMGTTDDHYVTTRKRFIAKTVLHNSTNINDIISRFTSLDTLKKHPSSTAD